MMPLPQFSTVEAALQDGGSPIEAAECHGVLCGILCASGAADMQKWVRHLFSQRTEKRDISESTLTVLHDLQQETTAGINHEELNFKLLLPDDPEPLDLRVEALAQWCGGFSLGLAMGGLNDSMLENPDVRDFVQDIQYISDAGFATDSGSDAEGEHNEQSLMEIQEYVRMGVLLLNDQLQPVARPPENQPPAIH